ncbi:hypothetical protein BD779DRAFT_1475062 [Infundibulicybe gibba]|nr:hypothetical protein BD779DRAFT_1475062 [Infundibulicybe gibba]
MANGVARVKGVYEAEANLQLPRLLREREAASINGRLLWGCGHACHTAGQSGDRIWALYPRSFIERVPWPPSRPRVGHSGMGTEHGRGTRALAQVASVPSLVAPSVTTPPSHFLIVRCPGAYGEKVGTLTLSFVREGGDGDVGAYVVQVRAAGESKAGHGLCKVFSVAALALGIIISPPNFAVLQCPDAVTTSLPRGRGQPCLGATHDVRTWEFYGRTLPSTIAGGGAGTVCVGKRASAVDIFWGKHLKEGREVLRNRQHSHVGSDV